MTQTLCQKVSSFSYKYLKSFIYNEISFYKKDYTIGVETGVFRN